MQLSEIILKKLRFHGGKERALARCDLLAYLRQIADPGLSDRWMRRVYENLPICTCADGLFIPVNKYEVDEYERYLNKKLPPWKGREKISRLRQAYPELWQSRQLELWL